MAFSEHMNFNNSIELNIFFKAEISTYILEEKTSYKLFLLVYALITAHLAIVIMNYRYASYKYVPPKLIICFCLFLCADHVIWTAH